MPSKTDPRANYWETTLTDAFDRASLDTDLTVDVAVVGAGIVGLTAAYLLSRAGQSVAVLEGARVGTGATARSSAKITSQHGLIYRRLMKDVGEPLARRYAAANEAALQDIANWVVAEQIDCDFERKSAYVYTTDRDSVATLQDEAQVAASLGLPARLTDHNESAMEIAAALCFEDQAQFNPVRYLTGLARAVARNAQIFENSRVTKIEDGATVLVHLANGACVRAREVVVATQQSIMPDGMYFAKAFPFSHSVIAAEVERDKASGGMCITANTPNYSFRSHASGDQHFVIAVGPSFKTGVGEDEAHSFALLNQFLRESFGIQRVRNQWTNEDYAPMDGLPFVGRASSDTPHCLVAVGFNAWGITTGTAAAKLISDLILGMPNDCEPLFDATRLSPIKGGGQFIKGNTQSARHMVGDRLTLQSVSQLRLRAGQACVAKLNGKKVAAYRDTDDQMHVVDATCTHPGCLVGWNETDRTWDCPCHGSRFDIDGAVLHGPATTPLKDRNNH